MTTPTTEKNPVTTANPDNGIVSPPSGTSKSTPTAWASAAARGVATIAASVAMKAVPASTRSWWKWLVWPDAGAATTPGAFMLFMSFLHHSVTGVRVALAGTRRSWPWGGHSVGSTGGRPVVTL